MVGSHSVYLSDGWRKTVVLSVIFERDGLDKQVLPAHGLSVEKVAGFVKVVSGSFGREKM